MRDARPDRSSTRRLQQAFLRGLGGLAEPGALFRRPPHEAVADRWHVYVHGYVTRITEALSLEHAAIARILGPEAFAALVSRYVSVFPPRSFDLARAGDRLPQFLEFDSLALDLPFLPDLARLEAAASACFTAADAEPVEWSALRRRDPDDVARMSFRLMPGVALVESEWPVADLWSLRFGGEDDALSIPIEGRPQSALAWRRGELVRVESVSPGEASLVAAAGPVALTLDELAELSGSGEGAPAVGAMLAAFRSLVERGVFVHQRSAGWTGALEASKEAS